MKLEQQVSSLEPSRRLEELGVKQESYFYWCEYTYYNDEGLLATDWLLKTKKEADKWVGLIFSAFTVAELDDLLKRFIHKIFFMETTQEWVVKPIIKAPMQADARPADARAKMIIYLIENKLITV